MTRRRWLYPLAALIAALAVFLSDRIFNPPRPAKKPLPPVRYSGPLKMSPGPATKSVPAPSVPAEQPPGPPTPSAPR